MKVGVSLVKHIAALLGITTAAPAINAEIRRKIHASSHYLSTTLIILNKEISDIMTIV